MGKKAFLPIILIFNIFPLVIFSQTLNIKGVVKDKAGNGIKSASIIVSQTKKGTIVNDDGSFVLSDVSINSSIEVSAIGFISKKINVSSDFLQIVLDSASSELNEVVVVAYGEQSKRALTSAVSTISAPDIERQQVTTIGQTLQGLAPGVLVINTTGQPGENPVIRIRGIGSINASSSPLIVVDGVPYYGNLNSINPNDIESENILKDAAAAALYGSRAANGVILITTKQGKKGLPVINAYSSIGWSKRAVDDYKFVSVEDYLKLAWEALRNTAEDNDIDNPSQYATTNLITGTGGLKYNPYSVANPIGTDGNLVSGAKQLWSTDWAKALTNEPSQRKNAGISISGASDIFKYFLSADYLKQDGYVLNSNFQRGNVRFNGEANIRPWLNLGLNMSLSTSTQNYPTQSGSAFSSAVGWGRTISSIYPLYMRDDNGDLVLDDKGKPQYDYGFSVPGRKVNMNRPVAQGSNAVGQRILDIDQYDRLQPSINTFAEISFTKNLKFKSTFGSNWYLYSASNYGNPNFGDAAAAGGRYGEEKDLTRDYTWNNMLQYNQKFGRHDLGIMGSYEAFNYHQSNLFAQKAGFSIPNIYDLGAYANYENAGSPKYDERLISYLARVTYNYDQRYYIEGTIRRDGSTRFAKENRWGTFYSVSGSWIISSERFMKNISWLNLLKLRGSYGQIGNNALLDANNNSQYFPYLSTYQTGYNDLDQSGVYIPNFADPNITWEKLGSTDIALDFAFLNNRISGSIDYYNKNTHDLLGSLVFPPSVGFQGISSNVGSMINRGIEIDLNTINVQNKNFSWKTNFNISTLKNKITKQSQETVISGSFIRKVGNSLYDFYIAKWAGVNSDNGLPQWYADETDQEGKVTGQKIVNSYSAATRYNMGSALPKVTGGLNNSINYKNFDLSFLINFSFGGKILDQDYIGLMSRAPNSGYQLDEDILKRWQKPGDVTDVPRLITTQTDYANASTRQLVSGSYARLRNVTLGYNVPILKKYPNSPVKNFRLYGQIDNYITWKKAKFNGLDPEVALNGVTSSSSTPFKTITIGFTADF